MNIQKIRRTSIATLLAAVVTPVCLSAQQEPPVGQEPPAGTRPDPTRQEPRDPNKPNVGVYDKDRRQDGDLAYASISKVIGAKVRMLPSVEEQREAARDNDAAKRPEGKIQDILVDHKSGECEYAVISFGGFIGIGDKTIAIPCEALKWNQSLERYDLDANEDRLKAMPSFDLSSARKDGLDAACATVEEQWKGTAGKDQVGIREATGGREDVGTTGERPVGERPVGERPIGEDKPFAEREAMEKERTFKDTKFQLVPVKFAAVTELGDHEIYTGATKFGKVNDLLMNRAENKIALVVVSRGGTLGVGGKDYLVPWQAFRLCSSGEERLLCTKLDPAKLESAVVYEKPKHGVVDPDAARRAQEQFKGDIDGLRK
jgi:sporulation protein YlmC with PRC-barrel domain